MMVNGDHIKVHADINMMFKQYLAELIKRHEVTQVLLSKELKLSEGAISLWLSGRRLPRYKQLEKLRDWIWIKEGGLPSSHNIALLESIFVQEQKEES